MITLDLSDPTPPYEQIRGQLVGLIRSGVLNAGHKLPSIRQLASDLRIAPGTVARAYKELEGAGLIESSRATGTRVRPGQQSDTALRDAAQQYATRARTNGASLSDALSAVRAAWEHGS
ncbi:MAG TPA: GntR family transcriptional regulator [Microbacteriaceae bacterium]|jgi:DNA-binding transcriptional regulator YhcF (GntR family)|nr:GntR family transcriptional regulator [Microbacteriaceae bacterium]HPZ34702.1 GntR family transcriptional regulator [Microbacteriaceae bacterium]HQC92512.1 GntR family transcriptional regulator [Microbacteriaceae bacterium]